MHRLIHSLLQNLQPTRMSVRSVRVDQESSFTIFKIFEQTNRMLDRYGKDSFIIFDFSRKVEAATVHAILQGGITINGDEYHFIGCSSNGLKERTCYLFKGSLDDVNQVWEECGSFSSIKSRYKRLKRIGLLFSSATPTHIEVANDEVVELADIETDGGNFTDGCGAVSVALANRLKERCKRIDDYHPSVFQIRYQGCKGVVMVDPNLKEGQQLVIRPSMKKFSPGTKPFKELWLCDHSRPYTFGHLNRQFITLLSSLGVNNEVFLHIQAEHFERLEQMLCNREAAFEMSLLDNQPELASLCITAESLNTLSNQLSKLRTKYVDSLEKLRLPVLKSRNVFGVCDPMGKLKYGQCYFRYTERGNCMTLHGRVVVAKNPCYLLGDVRVLTAVNVDGLEHLVDCIVFPTQGQRPHPSEIAGSDLDGDQYFVCWDEGLIVLRVEEPYDYPSEDIQETIDKVTQETLIDYFASQSNNMGKIDSYYKYWANKKGADCLECLTLGKLFSRSVDATKTGDVVSIQPNLKPPLEEDSNTDSASETNISNKMYVWEKMEKRAKEVKEKLIKDIVLKGDLDATSEDFLWSLLQYKVPILSDFQLFQLIQRWCSHQSFSGDENRQKLLEFTKHINFGEFTVDQQVEAIDAGIPLETVTNALNKSTLLPPALLEKFLLDDPHRNWRFYFHSTSAEFNWKHLLRGLQCHSESMVVIKLREEVTFVLHFLSPPKLGETDVGGGSVVAYFSSGHFNLNLQCVLGSEFKLILNEETLQLFRGKKTATFIWFSSEQPARGHGKHQDTLFDRISVDLTRFKRNVFQTNGHPKVNKQSFMRIEVFVKTSKFQPAYMDIAEADIQDDHPIEETAITGDIEDLPSDSEDQEKDTSMEIPSPYSRDAALSLLMQSAQEGHCINFHKTLKTILSKDDRDIPELLTALQELLKTMVKKHCHKPLSDEVTSCLQVIITSLYHYLKTPMDLLQFLSHAVQLGFSSLIEQIIDHILPNICATQSSDYIGVLTKWNLWYFFPPKMAIRLSQHLYTLYSSLCGQAPVSQQYSNQPAAGNASTTSMSESEVLQLAGNMCNTGSPQQCQLEVDGYVNHFAHLVLNHLLCEIFTSRDLLWKPDCDTNSSLVRMSCYDYKHPHSPSEPEDEDGEKSTACWMVGFNRPTKGIGSKNFTIGTYVVISLMKKQDSSQEVISLPVAVGRIVCASRHPAHIVTKISEPVPLCLKRSAQCRQGHWQLALVGNITTFNRSLKALTILRQTPTCTELFPLLVCSHYTVCTEAFKTADSNSSESQSVTDPAPLNSSQQNAVCASLKQRLTLIHGPPGTGKTHVACEIVRQQLAQDKHNPILIAAETNLAVDHLCEKLMSLGIRVVRIGKFEHVAPPIRSISLEGQIEKKRIQEGKEKLKSPFPNKKMAKVILNAAQVVAVTCTSAGDPNLKGMKFPFVIIDEATQVTEPTTLIPLVYGCQQLTLIGDPQQLAPTLPVPQISVDSELPVGKLSVTLFHRLQRVLPSILLTEQYRMHPEIAAFPSTKFYEGKLITAACRCQQQSAFQEEIPILEPSKPVVFIRVSKSENRIGTSFSNQAEAKAIVNIINYLISHKVSTLQMAVLTPYSGQLKCILHECQKENLHHIRVHTIDSFQGREADVIIFSTVRCNLQGELGFTNEKCRMNVLLTRARHGLIGIGCDETLSKGSQLWKEWLESVKVTDNIHGLDKLHGSDMERSDGGAGSYSSHRRSRGGGAHGGQVSEQNSWSHNTAQSGRSGGGLHGAGGGRSGGGAGGGRSGGGWHSATSGRAGGGPRSSRGFHSTRGREKTGDEGTCTHYGTQTQRSNYGRRRGGRGRSSSRSHGGRGDVMEPYRSAGATRGQREDSDGWRRSGSSNYRPRGRGRGRCYQSSFGSRSSGDI